MKAIYNMFLTKEKRKELPEIGSARTIVKNFTKSDFLTPRKVAAKLKIPVDTVKTTMKKIKFDKAIFALNGHKSEMVVTMGKANALYLHPMALDIFKEYINKQKAKA